MKKKGFTLVELLAVIAILAILVIIALPNVLGMFNNAKKNTFVTELQSIYDTGEKQFISDSMGNMTNFSTGIAYARVGGTNVANVETATTGYINKGFKSLELSGTQAIDYYIHFTLAGKVDKFYATDGQYQFIYEGTDLKKEKITATTIKEGTSGCTAADSDNTAKTITSGGKDTGVITVADAMSYCTDWGKVVLEYDAAKGLKSTFVVKYNKADKAA